MTELDSQVHALREVLLEVPPRQRKSIGEKLDRLLPPRNPKIVLRELGKLLKQAQRAAEAVEKRRRHLPVPSFPAELPICEHQEAIVEAIQQHQVLVLAGETGSGKTTQVPKMCLKAGYGARGRIGCTQPRRVAALSLSQRIAEELGVSHGREVGSQIRFADRTSSQTAVKVMTDGILLNEIQQDPDLLDYEVIIIDEAHERSLNIDFILGYLRLLRWRRPDLRIIITSATINTRLFADAFDNAPIIEVSGRTYPVSVRYRPLDMISEESGDLSFVEAAVQVVRGILSESRSGDVLVFMPTERDIRETQDLIDRASPAFCETVPLFGRLAPADQQRIFRPSSKRKIIIATNIAETSITVPGIRYVVDTGLARVSRFSAHTRTQRLPIEKISQASAEQRKGRAGRVAEGVCIRLYSEKDYEERPPFMEPEIRRSNLAQVILQMLSFKIGNIDTFPFVEPPGKAAITGGFKQLRELGAIDANHQLTSLGRDLGKIPADPTIGRILLQGKKQGVLGEVLVIASGLSSQDPRERPLEQEKQADDMHRRFVDRGSDFITLLNIWDSFQEQSENLSQSKLRKYCQKHFLNFVRMREWRDTHDQFSYILRDLDIDIPPRVRNQELNTSGIHRAILAGFLGNVATREDGNTYRATYNRRVMLFPGSGLAIKPKRDGKGRLAKPNPEAPDRSTPAWIVAAEWVETRQLFARTNGKIEPRWIIELAGDLCTKSYEDEKWDSKREAAVVKERTRLYGLEITMRWRTLSAIRPERATEIFVLEGLIAGEIAKAPPFLLHNRSVAEAVEQALARNREGSMAQVEDSLYQFYQDRLPVGIGSLADLRGFAKAEHGGSLDFLKAEMSDLIGKEPVTGSYDFPTHVNAGGTQLPIRYNYAPGNEADGAEIEAGLEVFPALSPAILDWAIPGFWRERVDAHLRALPKEVRKQIFPIKEAIDTLVEALEPANESFEHELSRLIRRHYRIALSIASLEAGQVAPHLLPRLKLVDHTQGKVLGSSRDWSKLEAIAARARSGMKVSEPASATAGSSLWDRARREWSIRERTSWDFGDLPERISLGQAAGVDLWAHPGLQPEPVAGAGVRVELFSKSEDARTASVKGWRRLAELALSRDLAWLERDLKELERVGPIAAPLVGLKDLEGHARRAMLRYFTIPASVLPMHQARFEAFVEASRRTIKGYVPRLADQLHQILELRNRLSLLKRGYPNLRQDLARLVPRDFLARTPLEHLTTLELCLKGMEKRAERYPSNPHRDAERAERLEKWRLLFAKLIEEKSVRALDTRELNELFWRIERFGVTLFAQELTGREGISEKQLARSVEALRGEAKAGK